MPSLDFDREQAIFCRDYDRGLPHFERIMTATMTGVRKTIAEAGIGERVTRDTPHIFPLGITGDTVH